MNVLENGGASDDQSRFVMPVSDELIACYMVGRSSPSTRKGRLIGVVSSENEAQRFLDGAVDVRFVETV